MAQAVVRSYRRAKASKGRAIYEINGRKFYDVPSLRAYLKRLIEKHEREYKELKKKARTVKNPVLKAKYRRLAMKHATEAWNLREFYQGLAMCKRAGRKGRDCVMWALLR